MRERILLEEQALDSYGNFMFGLLAFWRKVGTWPEMVTVVSHAFKRARVLDLHVKAARWPRAKVEFVGIDPGYMVEGSGEWDGERMESVLRGERERGYGAWEGDVVGMGEVLRGKRRERNVWGVRQVWFESEEERERSGVRSRVVVDKEVGGVWEEVLLDMRQPWEDE